MPAQWIISGSIWHDSRHASASIPIPSTPWNGAREDSGKIIKITWITWSILSISCQLKHDLQSHGFPPVDQWHPHIPSPPVADVWSLISLVISQMTHVIASSTSTSKKSQRSFGPLMTTSTSQMASLASNWRIPNQQQSIISNTSNRLDFYAVAPSIFSVWSSWRERILDILKRQRWI